MQGALGFDVELEAVVHAQAGEHCFALVAPGVGADAHPGTLGLEAGQQLPHTGLEFHGLVQLGDDRAHHAEVVLRPQGQRVLPDEVLRPVRHAHAQERGAQVGPWGAAVAAQQRQRGVLPHRSHAVGQGAVHIKDPLVAVHAVLLTVIIY